MGSIDTDQGQAGGAVALQPQSVELFGRYTLYDFGIRSVADGTEQDLGAGPIAESVMVIVPSLGKKALGDLGDKLRDEDLPGAERLMDVVDELEDPGGRTATLISMDSLEFLVEGRAPKVGQSTLEEDLRQRGDIIRRYLAALAQVPQPDFSLTAAVYYQIDS